MEESTDKGDSHVNAARHVSGRAAGSLKSPLPGRSSPRSRRLHSGKTSRRDSKVGHSGFRWQWIRSNRVLLWLMLITLWAYIGFHVQSKWAHGDHRNTGFFGYRIRKHHSDNKGITKRITEPPGSNGTAFSGEQATSLKGKESGSEKKTGVGLLRKGTLASTRLNGTKKSSRRSERKLRRSSANLKSQVTNNNTDDMEEGMIPRKNTSYGLIVGPFGRTEDSILGWSPSKRRGTCDRKGEFARIVWSRSFVLIFHELSMTGAPISMMELATEILSCGGTVSAVVLSMRGGLMTEIDRRGIKVLRDRARPSFKTAMKADLIIAGSAVCSSWIDQYLVHNPAGSTQIVWWIMENRREYFERSKFLLSRVKMLNFLSSSQSKQWLSWCEEEKIQLKMQPMIVPLSVNDELAFVSGIPCSLNTPAFTVEKMMEKRSLLRAAVRKEMGLHDNDMLVMSLSSINPTKGQRIFLESALLVAEKNVSLRYFESGDTFEVKFLSNITHENNATNLSNITHENNVTLRMEVDPAALPKIAKQEDVPADGNTNNSTSLTSKRRRRRRRIKTADIHLNHTSNNKGQLDFQKMRSLLSKDNELQEMDLKLLIGSVGSKSNKVLYVKTILRFLSQHSNLSKIILWTPATTRVASLYAAADVYVINAQGIGETFGRVTIEAMAFGLPVLGTNAGGTQEIVEHNVTGLLHPVGHEGVEVLARNIKYLLNNPSLREEMGMMGRKRVQEKYLKNHTYQRFAKVLVKCMKIK